MTKVAFIKRVMQIMNELGWNDTHADAFAGADTTKIEGHIVSVFVDAWRKAVNLFPTSYFNIKNFSGCKLVSDFSSGTGYIILPDDFYRLVLFKMDGWDKPVETLYSFNDPIASIQRNEYTRGTYIRPVCILNQKSTTGRVKDKKVVISKSILEYYSLPKGRKHDIEEALYIPLISSLDEQQTIDEKLFVPLAYLTASLVFNIFEKPEISASLEKTAIEIIN